MCWNELNKYTNNNQRENQHSITMATTNIHPTSDVSSSDASEHHHHRTKKVIGIIGGSGPEAGLDLFQKILETHRRRLGKLYRSDRDAPNIVLMNVPGIGGPRKAIDVTPGKGTYDESLQALMEAIQKIVPLVDVMCVACHTLHVFEPQIKKILHSMGKDPSSFFVSMVGVAIKACKGSRLSQNDEQQQQPTKIAILGGPVTMDLRSTSAPSSYKRVLDELGEDIVHVPSGLATKVVQTIIWKTKEDGRPPALGESALEEYKDLLEDIASEGVGVCVLACTELSLIETVHDLGGRTSSNSGFLPAMQFLDPTEVVADAVLDATQSYPNNNDDGIH